MSTPPAGISPADWLATPESVRHLVAQFQLPQQENEQLRQQLAAQAVRISELEERLIRNSRNSSKPPSSDGPEIKPLVPTKPSVPPRKLANIVFGSFQGVSRQVPWPPANFIVAEHQGKNPELLSI